MILGVKSHGNTNEAHLMYAALDEEHPYYRTNYRAHRDAHEFYDNNHVWKVVNVNTSTSPATFQLQSLANEAAFLPNGDGFNNGSAAANIYLQAVTAYDITADTRDNTPRFAISFTNTTNNDHNTYHFNGAIGNITDSNSGDAQIGFWGAPENISTSGTWGAYAFYKAETITYTSAITPTYVSTNGATGNEGAAKMVDGNVNTKWGQGSLSSDPYYVILKAGESPVCVKGYSLWNGNDTFDYQGRRATAWKLQGSNTENGEWHDIDVRSNEVMLPENKKPNTYKADNSESYTYYKLTINEIDTRGQHGDMFQFSEFKLYVSSDEGHSQEEISALQAKIDDVLNKVVFNKVIGYPYYSDNQTEISNLLAYSSNYQSEVTNANYDAALDALNVVYGLTNIVLPTPGKAYKIAFSSESGVKKYIQASQNKVGDSSTAAEFVCGKDGDKFIFVLKDGSKFMNYQGANTALASYNAEYNSFTIQPLATSTSDKLGTSTAADRFGYVYMTSAKRASGNNNAGCMLVDQSSGAYSNSTVPFFNGTLTSAITFEEVANDVYVKLTNPNEGGTSGLDGKYVGTFSAPYHVALPTGVKAYTAAIEGTTVNFAELGTTVPANTGVLLYAESADADINKNAVPAGTSAAAGANAFKAMIDGTINEGDYVLGKGTNGVGFYARVSATTAKNKAYIPASAASQINAFRFDFEEQTTGVESLQSEKSTGMAFDLAGRRINANAKGISIVNGKKYIK